MLEFANGLVSEKEENPDLGIILDKHLDLETEAEWLGKLLAGVETAQNINVVAEVEGRLIANSDVQRGRFFDESHHGKLGISVSKEYRDLGVGFEMMKTLVEESRKAGLKTIELEVFANNPKAIHVYEKVGFVQAGRIPKKIFRKGKSTDIIVMAIEL